MPPTLGARKLYSKATIAAAINVPIKAIIGYMIIRYIAPIAAMELATSVTTAVVLLFRVIIVVLISYNKE